MVPSKLKRLFTFKLPSLACKDIKYLRRLMEQNKKHTNIVTSSVLFSEKTQEASYNVAD
jgi:hypothetical protein